MKRIAFGLWVAVASVVATIGGGDAARAAEIRVLTSVALSAALDELKPV